MSVSFRDAYTTHGVDNYYTLVANTYKNPHEPGVQKALRKILESIVPVDPLKPYYRLLDLAAGSGEATLAAAHWFSTRRPSYRLLISAHDPFTASLYTTRTGGRPCGTQSFRDIQTGGLEVSPGRSSSKNDVVVCSFALHLCPASEVWGLLYTLSCECRWLVVLAPHKRPEVGSEHGWERMGREVCVERVRGRLFRSLNFEDVEEVEVEAEVGEGRGEGGEGGGGRGRAEKEGAEKEEVKKEDAVVAEGEEKKQEVKTKDVEAATNEPQDKKEEVVENTAN
ncbi:uncharacterized protein H6S33_003515 [Morchella sextelata]|uniref:uncharacterized protein n=1 Tax=Morchella sextelata TaxID=1174677 RepID=UPI001D0487C1|nr:uncharacterized protein H6S33_003515 [Morchella sextelata]KAH0606681.1 hypothetical protein H6S33_003515 [Morchella sextelata]